MYANAAMEIMHKICRTIVGPCVATHICKTPLMIDDVRAQALEWYERLRWNGGGLCSYRRLEKCIFMIRPYPITCRLLLRSRELSRQGDLDWEFA